MWEYLGLFLSALSSATLFPGSSEIALSALLFNSTLNWFGLWGIATLGNVLGSCLNYGLGLKMMDYQDKRWFPVSKSQVDKASSVFERYGLWSLCFAWVPVIGDPLTVVAGAFKLPFRLFLFLVILSKGGRYDFIFLGVSVVFG